MLIDCENVEKKVAISDAKTGGFIMSIKVEKKENNIASFELEIGAEAFEAAMQKSYKKNVKQFNIHGFRKGKAPRKMIEKMYSPAVFYDDAINFVFPDEYDKAVKEAGIEPVDRPEVDVKQWPEDGKNLILTVDVVCKPEVTLSKFDKVEVEVPKYPVAKKDVDAEIDRLKEQNSRLVSIEDRPAAKGDTITFDFDGYVDGKQFEGGKAEGYTLVLGSGQFIPGFEDQLIGKNIDEDIDVNVTFPDEYTEKSLEGKEALFKCKIHQIQVKEYPEIDDEFAKDVSEFDTLKDLRADLKKKLEEKSEKRAKEELDNKVVEFLISKMKADIPECMINERVENLVNDFGMRLSYQGMKLEDYLKYAGMDMDTFKAQYKPQAENQVKGMLAIDAYAAKEKITATDDEVEEEYKKMAEQYKMEVDAIKGYIAKEDLAKDVVTNKAIAKLVSLVSDTPAKKPAAKKAPAKKESAAAETEKKPAAKKTAAKKPAAKKPAAKKEDK